MSTEQLMKLIPLTQGQFAIVDLSDFEWLNQWKWYAIRDDHTKGFYAARAEYPNKRMIRMHRMIMNAPRGVMVDHKDGNGLYNVRSNLRLCTQAQNNHNQKVGLGFSSSYKGVCYSKKRKLWTAQIRINRILVYLGAFAKEGDAAIAYNKKAVEAYGEFARLNEIERNDNELV